jgi:O-antigen ligase
VDGLLRVIRLGLFGLLFLSPLPFGSVQPGALITVEMWALALGALAVVAIWLSPGLLSQDGKRLLIPAGLLVLLGVLQVVPLPRAFVDFLGSPAARSRELLAPLLPETFESWVPISFSAPDTVDAITRLVAYMLVGIAAAVSLRERKQLRMAVSVLAASAVFQAIYGAAEYVSGHQHIFGYAKKYYLDSATGTFVNRNHFAGYLAMALPLTLIGFVGRGGVRKADSIRAWFVCLLEPRYLRRFLFAIAAFVIVIGIFLSNSRGGLAAAVLALTVYFLGASFNRRRLLALFLILLLPALFLSWQELSAPGERFLVDNKEMASLNSRLPIWRAALRMVPAFMPLGSGYGTFQGAFLLYQPPDTRSRWDHAHNDWLQNVVEGGIFGTLAVFAGVWLIARKAWKARGKLAPTHWWYLNGLVAAIAAIAFHSLIDFSLRIPAVAALTAVLVGGTASPYFSEESPRLARYRSSGRREP